MIDVRLMAALGVVVRACVRFVPEHVLDRIPMSRLDDTCRHARGQTEFVRGRRERRMKALLVVGLLLGVGLPVNEATGQTAACRKALAAYRGAVEAFVHATVALGPANLLRTCTALDALFNARKRKDATQKRVRSACPAGTIRTDDTSQWKQFLQVERTRIAECKLLKTTRPR